MASRTGAWLTPSCRAISDSTIRVPGCSEPSRTKPRTMAYTWSDSSALGSASLKFAVIGAPPYSSTNDSEQRTKDLHQAAF
jgi:hypothetical protein